VSAGHLLISTWRKPVQDGGDDFQGSSAMRAILNVNIEHQLKQARLTDTYGNRGRWHSIIPAGWITFVFLATKHNLRTKLRVGREHAMETNEVEPCPGD